MLLTKSIFFKYCGTVMQKGCILRIPKNFYYIAHKDTLKSILEKGILSRNKADSIWVKIGLKKTKSIHDDDIIKVRKDKKFKGRSLWEYANVYFQARNPMLYRVIQEYGVENIIVLQIKSDIIHGKNVGITDGNAASSSTKFFEDVSEELKNLSSDIFEKEYWNASDKRKRMAELLVYNYIPREKIIGIYVANERAADEVRKLYPSANVVPNPDMFFRHEFHKKLSDRLTLVKGDMFFSKMQTFTVSVNTVGVMGKGLASRAKYQFPDVYVYYQDLCKQGGLKMGTPFLYKRDDNFAQVLTEDNTKLLTENGSRWFLLFPTKTHWKNRSEVHGIEDGMRWLLENYKRAGIRSIALPALGCGLGGLEWRDIGPLMYKYLAKMDIPCNIYLPNEGNVPEEQLTLQFLTKK